MNLIRIVMVSLVLAFTSACTVIVASDNVTTTSQVDDPRVIDVEL